MTSGTNSRSWFLLELDLADPRDFNALHKGCQPRQERDNEQTESHRVERYRWPDQSRHGDQDGGYGLRIGLGRGLNYGPH